MVCACTASVAGSVVVCIISKDLLFLAWAISLFEFEYCRIYAFFVLIFEPKSALALVFTLFVCLDWGKDSRKRFFFKREVLPIHWIVFSKYEEKNYNRFQINRRKLLHINFSITSLHDFMFLKFSETFNKYAIEYLRGMQIIDSFLA